ncbi:MAG: hypothetical protein WDZ63_12240 [Burkholderiales bacterium]
MDKKTIYSKTGKGVLEIKNKAAKLSKDLGRILSLIDGKSTVADLIARSRMSDADVSRCLKQLEDSGYIKEFANPSAGYSGGPPADTSYVDDLDFTSTLAPGKRVYQSSQTEWRAREQADRAKAEAEARQKRDEAERKKKEEAVKAEREEAARLARIEAERKAKEAAALKAKAEGERKAKLQEEEMEKTTRDLSKILEAERQALEKSDKGKKIAAEEAARKAKEEAERRAKEEEARRAKEEAERKKREEEEKRRREDEERKRREEEERKRKEEEERKRREEEERKRKAEEERRRREEEERRRREEEERKRKEEEERKRREEAERKRKEEEERKRREEEKKRKEEEERRRREEEERAREEEAARRRREEEEERLRQEDDERSREEEERQHGEPAESETSGEDALAADGVELEEIDLPSLEESGGSFLDSFERQQEALRKQAEEEERARKKADEERRAIERAQREEDARLEAEHRAVEEAERRERMEREEEERRARDRKREEEYQRRIEQEESRKKQEQEEKQRKEQQKIEEGRRTREEELARKRKEAEEAERKRRELKALQKQGRVRSPIDRMKPVVIGLVAVIAVAIAALEFAPVGGYVPAVEKLASDHIGEPVSIQSMDLSALSGFSFRLQNVKIGTTQDVEIASVTLAPTLGSLFSERKIIPSIEADTVRIAPEALGRLPAWLKAATADGRVQVEQLTLRGVSIETRGLQLPPLNAMFRFGSDASITHTRLETSDNKFSSELVPKQGRWDLTVNARSWVPPIGPGIEIGDLTASGSASRTELRIDEFDARLYGGAVTGNALVSWADGWRASGELNAARIDLAQLMGVFTSTARTSGALEAKGRFEMQSDSVHTLLDNPRIDTTFTVRRGNVDGVDLVRALQAGRAGTTGGSTKFEELTGTLSLANRRYEYRNLQLSAGILNAVGNLAIAPNQDVSGRVFVELRSQSNQLRNNLLVTGTLRAVTLRP